MMTSWMCPYSRAARRIANSDVGPLGQRLADADQDAGGERHADPAGVVEHPQPDRRLLVRRAVVRAARLRPQPGRGGLQHHAHARRDRLEPLQLGPAQHARVEVRQQAGLLQHRDRASPARSPASSRSRARRATAAPAGQRSSGRSPSVNSASLQPCAAPSRAIASTSSRSRNARRQPVRHGGERAVVAPVPAQPGQRDEDLLGVRDDARPPGVAQPGVADRRRRSASSSSSAGAAGGEQDGRLVGVEGLAVGGAAQRPPDARRRWGRAHRRRRRRLVGHAASLGRGSGKSRGLGH